LVFVLWSELLEHVDMETVWTRAISILLGTAEVDSSIRFAWFQRLVWTLPFAVSWTIGIGVAQELLPILAAQCSGVRE
jgi:hypothetical protein